MKEDRKLQFPIPQTARHRRAEEVLNRFSSKLAREKFNNGKNSKSEL